MTKRLFFKRAVLTLTFRKPIDKLIWLVAGRFRFSADRLLKAGKDSVFYMKR